MFAILILLGAIFTILFGFCIVLAADDKSPLLALLFAVLLAVSVMVLTFGIVGINNVILSGSGLASLTKETINIAPGQQFTLQANNGFYEIESTSTAEALTVCDPGGCSQVFVGPNSPDFVQLSGDNNNTVVISDAQSQSVSPTVIY